MNRFLMLLLVAVGALIGNGATADAYQVFKNEASPENAFRYLHQVATHPRCANCHGQEIDGVHRPTVGDDRRRHPMNISAANNLQLMFANFQFQPVPKSDKPVNCRSCHQTKNGSAPGMPPGAANNLMPGFVWHMPPATMVVPVGIEPHELCENWLNPAKNSFLAFRGSRDDMKTFKKEFVHHVHDDPLIRWAWQPGPGRSSAPGTHKDFVMAMKTWIKGGAPCPD